MGGEGRSRRPPEKAKKAPEPLSRQKLEQAALAYLNRFDVSAAKLRQYLSQRAHKAGGDEQASQWITELVERYLGSGVLDDARLARNLTSQLTQRGKSTRAIAQKLAVRGVPKDVANELLSSRKQEEPGAELEAARAYARKRRLGPHRPADARAEHRQKDLASLARQGFSFDVARQALAAREGGDDDF